MRRHGLGLLGAAAGALVLGSCGAAVPPAGVSLSHGNGSTPTSSSSTTTTSAAGGSSAAPAGTGSGASGTGGQSARATATTAAPATASGTSGPAPAAPGTYHYNQSGSFSVAGSSQNAPAQGTIVVDPPTSTGPGSYSQVWHSYVDPSQPPSDTTFAISPGGIAIVSQVIRMTYGGQTQSFTCSFSSPMVIVQWPARVGYHFTGNANCGSFTVSTSGSITGTQSASVGGTAVPTYVVTTDITTSGQVVSTGTETDWFDPAHDIDVHQATSQKGNYGPFSFQSQTTRDLASPRPS